MGKLPNTIVKIDPMCIDLVCLASKHFYLSTLITYYLKKWGKTSQDQGHSKD